MYLGRLYPVLIVLVLFVYALRAGVVPMSDPFNVFAEEQAMETGFRFREIGLPEAMKKQREYHVAMEQVRAYVGVADYNNDGFEDLVSIYNEQGSAPQLTLFENQNGKSFRLANEEAGLGDLAYAEGLASAVFADLNNDGWEDLYLARSGKNHLVLKNEKGKFRRWFEVPLIEDTQTPGLADFNLDGYLDVYLPNRIPSDIFLNSGLRVSAVQVSSTKNDSGARDLIFFNSGGRELRDVSDGLKFRSTRYTWAVGFADFNGDLYPDFFLANDFGQDQLFMNHGGRRVEDITQRAFGNLRSRFSMSAEVGDVNGDGLPDIYASNTNAATLRSGFNSMWINNGGREPAFSDEAQALGIDGCGWSWGSKFVDFDLDGDLDLIVVNGFYGSQDTEFWYYVGYNRLTPVGLRNIPGGGIKVGENTSIAPGQKSCLFVNNGGKYDNVATSVGFDNMMSNRGLALTDFDNDGAVDVFVGNLFNEPTLYRNERQTPNGWIGVSLEGRKSNRSGIGAKLTLSQGGRKFTQEIFPTNGFQAQSTKRAVFSLDPEKPFALEVRWPSGKMQKISRLTPNTYNKVTEL